MGLSFECPGFKSQPISKPNNVLQKEPSRFGTTSTHQIYEIAAHNTNIVKSNHTHELSEVAHSVST